MLRLLLFLALLLLSPESWGTNLWQCTYPDGSVEWRDRPCPPTPGIEASRRSAGGGNGTFSTIPPDRPPESLLKRAERSRQRARTVSRQGRPVPEAGQGDTDLRCAEYEKRIDAIEYRLRKGYTVSEGNELRAERRRIERLLARACR